MAPARSRAGLVRLLTLSSVALGTAAGGAGYYLQRAPPSPARASSSPSSSSSIPPSCYSSQTSSPGLSSGMSTDAALLSLLRAQFAHGGPDGFDALCDIHPDEMDQIISEFLHTASQLEQLGRLHEAEADNALQPYLDRFVDKSSPLVVTAVSEKLVAAIDAFLRELAVHDRAPAVAVVADEALLVLQRLQATRVLEKDDDGGHWRRPTAVRDALAILADGTDKIRQAKKETAAPTTTAARFGGFGGGFGGSGRKVADVEKRLKAVREAMVAFGLPNRGPGGD